MIRKLDVKEHMVASTCSKGVFYSKYKYSPFDVKLVNYNNDIITMRAYGKVYDDKNIDINIVFDRKDIKPIRIINNIKEDKKEVLKMTKIDKEGALIDLKDLLVISKVDTEHEGMNSLNTYSIKFVFKADNTHINGTRTYIHQYKNKLTRDQWFSIITKEMEVC